MQGILKDILAGRKVHATGATREDVPFEVPEVQAGDTNCELCHQSFKSTGSLRHHTKTHTGILDGPVTSVAKCWPPGSCLSSTRKAVVRRRGIGARGARKATQPSRHYWHTSKLSMVLLQQ